MDCCGLASSPMAITVQYIYLHYVYKVPSIFLQELSQGDSMIVLMSTCLTRFTAGMVYLLSQCFSEVSDDVIDKYIPSYLLWLPK